MIRRPAAPRWSLTAAAAAGVVAAWQAIAGVLGGQHLMASPTDIVAAFVNARQVWPAAIAATGVPAASGWLLGTAVGVLLAMVALLIPGFERPTLRMAAASYGLPLVAIDPILQATLTGQGPSVALAALMVVFTTTVAVVLGLRAAPSAALDIAHGFGGSRWRILVRVRLRAAVPMLLTSARVSWPAALTGALIGEFVGGGSGLGAFMIEQAALVETARVWAAAMVLAALALAGVVLAGITARVTGRLEQADTAATLRSHPAGPWGRVASTAAAVALSTAALCLLWVGYLRLFHVSAFVARTPSDVGRYLLHGTDRGVLVGALGVTVRDVGVGLAVGWLAGVISAVALSASRIMRPALLPVAVGLNAIPIVAVVPLLTLLFGNGVAAVAVIVAVLTYFSSLILMLDGLGAAPADLLAVANSYAASPWRVLLHIRIPHALPAAAAALRIAAPAAVAGALVAEWLGSGAGFGHLMLADAAQSNYDRLWAATVVMTVVAVAGYALVDAMERAVVTRFGAA